MTSVHLGMQKSILLPINLGLALLLENVRGTGFVNDPLADQVDLWYSKKQLLGHIDAEMTSVTGLITSTNSTCIAKRLQDNKSKTCHLNWSICRAVTTSSPKVCNMYLGIPGS